MIIIKTITLLIVLLCARRTSGYTLQDNWVGGAIFNNFDYYSGADPTHGYVFFANQQQATSWGYTTTSNNQAVIKSDSSSVSSGAGRGSVRLHSKNAYSRGLFIFDVQHMPSGCGTWPALWTANLDVWPAGGEIDILEGVNNQTTNTMTMHTAVGCKFATGINGQTGTTVTGDCGINNAQPGCAVSDADTKTYGNGFNNNGGGVYAMQWETSGIYIWFFPRSSIPADIKNGAPIPAGWGLPRANFYYGSGCNNGFFYNHRIIIDNTFCGDWAGKVFGSQCGGDCQTFVQNNPGAFANAYWVFNYIKVFV